MGIGRLDDHDVDPQTAARALASAVGAAERAFEQLGQPLPPLALLAIVALGVAYVALRGRYLVPLASALNLSSIRFLPLELCAGLPHPAAI